MENNVPNFELIVADPMEAKKLLAELFKLIRTKKVSDLTSSMHIDKHKLNILVTWMEAPLEKQFLKG